MSVATTISAEGDGGSAKLAGLAEAIGEQGLEAAHEVIGQDVEALVKSTLQDRDDITNALGGKRTHWFGMAAKATAHYSTSESASITVTHTGIRMMYYGSDVCGPILPGKGTSIKTGKPTRLLTIPAIAETYGTRADEWPNLVVLYTNDGGHRRPFALADSTEGRYVEKSGLNKPVAIKKQKATGESWVAKKAASAASMKIMFWLVRSVWIHPHPEILPDAATIRATAVEALRKYVRTTTGGKGKHV